ncbi:hypothetical protein BMETH_156_3 [methanotrophic bacterial endosymbiont of Bathymodiolus sp.]|nr:hypothetical protein BMETH_156_3 [methanotrophic bacterial endosymbiont of Bathymodiolus sp.]
MNALLKCTLLLGIQCNVLVKHHLLRHNFYYSHVFFVQHLFMTKR